MATNGFDFSKQLDALRRAEVELPIILANTGQRFYLNNFDKEQWDGASWRPRKSSKNTHKLLVNTGNLRGAVANCIRSYTWDEILWSVGVDYAKYQNEGTNTIPARQFFGRSDQLIAKLKAKIRQAGKDILK